VAAVNRVERYNLGRIEQKTGCLEPDQRERYGSTDANARTANVLLAVGLHRAGTVTISRRPRLSFFDQVTYFNRGRDTEDDLVVVQPGRVPGVEIGDGFETSCSASGPTSRSLTPTT
jgi:hypothetical protein